MKLNQDCVRDLLLYLEENLSLGDSLNISSDFHEEALCNYSTDDLIYTAQKLLEADYLDAEVMHFLGSKTPNIRIRSITYQGHQFLDTIRDNTIWKSTKYTASKVTSVSLPILQQIATALIKTALNIP